MGVGGVLVSVQGGVSIWGGVSPIQRVWGRLSVWRGSLSGGSQYRGPLSRGSLSRGSLSRWDFSVQGGLCQGDPPDRDPPDRDPPYGNEQAVRVLLECILLVSI